MINHEAINNQRKNMTTQDALLGILFTFYILFAFGVAGAIDCDEYYGGQGVDVSMVR